MSYAIERKHRGRDHLFQDSTSTVRVFSFRRVDFFIFRNLSQGRYQHHNSDGDQPLLRCRYQEMSTRHASRRSDFARTRVIEATRCNESRAARSIPRGNVRLTNNWKIDSDGFVNPGGNAVVIAIGAAAPVKTPLIGPPVSFKQVPSVPASWAVAPFDDAA